MNDATRILEPKVKRDANGKIVHVSVVFGPHHFFEAYVEDGKVHCSMGATHHGVRADASEVNGDFEQLVNGLMRAHSEKSF